MLEKKAMVTGNPFPAAKKTPFLFNYSFSQMRQLGIFPVKGNRFGGTTALFFLFSCRGTFPILG